MTIITIFAAMFTDGVPVLMFLLAVPCDTILLTVAMLTGVLHRC